MISVILNSFNQKKYIRKSIESVLSQSFDNFELIINDNASTDGTVEILKEFESINKIKIIYNEKNENIGKRLNESIKISNGEFISFLYSDDFYQKDKLSFQFELIKKLSKNYGLVYGPGYFFNDLGLKKIKKVPKIKKNSLIEMLSQTETSIDMISPLFRKSCFQNIKFLENIFAEGEAIIFRIACDYEVFYHDEILVNHRVTNENRGKAIIKNYYMSKVSLFMIKGHFLYKQKIIKKKINNYFAQNALRTSWGNLRANGSKLQSLKLYQEALEFSFKTILNFRSFLIIISILIPKFILKHLNNFFNRKGLAKNIILKNYGGSDIKN